MVPMRAKAGGSSPIGVYCRYHLELRRDAIPNGALPLLPSSHCEVQEPGSKDRNRRARLIAVYLPQFHPTPENDLWWGKGFTEWTNVAKAKPLFKGHYQPKLPADLGFYDLRVPEVREAQANLARNAGIEGFCYYHYWFGGKRLLERPFQEVVASGKPDFPFCLCWANQTWSGIWHAAPNRILIEQTYPGEEDNKNHFLALLDAFLDKRYMRVGGRPIFTIFRPTELPNATAFISQWQELASQYGLPGFHFIAHVTNSEFGFDYKSAGFDACVSVYTHRIFDHGKMMGMWKRCLRSLGRPTFVKPYRDALRCMLEGCSKEPDVYPCAIPNWDNSARSGMRGRVLHESTPELFRKHLREALALVDSRPAEQRLVFLKSWNEWAEGNYLEPDQRFGLEYLNVIQQENSP